MLRPISLKNHTSKEFIKILQAKLNQISGDELSASTCGNCGSNPNCQSHCGEKS